MDDVGAALTPAGPAGRRHWGMDALRYVTIGVLSTGIDLGLLVVLHDGVNVALGVATTAAFVTSLLFNFFLNRYWMAGGGRQGIGGHAVRFGLLVMANYLITLVVVTSAPTVGIPYFVAKLGVVAVSTAWNFLLYRYWIFAPPRQPADPAVTGGGEP